ncbi:AIM24 family protein [Acidithiobacillus sp. MC6.1]|nr:AIM24 family protein [Acidithiobacillus sp. MC6.1]
MMEPKLLKPAKAGSAAGVRFRLEGSTIPVLTLELAPLSFVLFEHHTLLWKDPQIVISATSPKSGRSFRGRPSWLMMASGPGSLGLSRDCVGKIFGVALHGGDTLLAPVPHFLAASGAVSIESFPGAGGGCPAKGDTAPNVDRFSVSEGAKGMVWLHGYGDVWELALAEGMSFDMDPGAWVARDPSIHLESIGLGSLSTDLSACENWGIYRAQGQGTIWVQSGGVGPAHG